MEISFSIIVVSDSVYNGEREDVSGEIARNMLLERGYRVIGKIIVPNDPKLILKALRKSSMKSDVVILIGGTGPSPRDITIDLVEDIAWRRLPGFGEFFRKESFHEVGYRALVSRAELYILYDGTIAVVLPGSSNAVKTGLEILLSIIEHLVEETKRFEGPHRIHHGEK